METAELAAQNERTVAVQRRIVSSSCCIGQIPQHSRSLRRDRSSVGVKPTDLAYVLTAVLS